jgi:hypothetical protein
MVMMNKPVTKSQLLYYIRAERKRLDNALKGLTDADMLKTEAAGEWSVKDIMAHISAWEKSLLKWYQTGVRGEKQVMPEWEKPGVIDEINRGIYERNLKRKLADVKAEFRDSFNIVFKTIESIPEEAMFTPSKYDWTGKTTLVDYIAANTSGHYTDHLAMIEAIKNKLGR